MRTSLKFTAALLGAATSVMSFADIAGATPPPAPAGSTIGFDEINDLAPAGGSDTTYAVQNSLSQLYNASPGCARKLTNPSVDICLAGQTGAAPFANWDHDVIAQTFPTGSSAGVACLLGTSTCNVPIRSARSSRALTSAEVTAGARQWGFARDGIAVVNSNRSDVNGNALNIAKTTLVSIYNCQQNSPSNDYWKWSDIGDVGPDASNYIIPIGMNSSSGTAADWATYLGFANAGAMNAVTCVHKLSNNVAPFENDLKQLRDDAGVPAGLTGPDAAMPLSQIYNEGRYIWGQSFAAWKTLPAQRLTAGLMQVDGKSINPGTIANTSASGWQPARYVYHMTLAADADMSTSTYPAMASTTVGGSGGAVREYMRWMCKTQADHTLNGDTGVNYFLDIENAIVNAGFISVPVTQRQWGRCRK